jgi:hypothetical protein
MKQVRLLGQQLLDCAVGREPFLSNVAELRRQREELRKAAKICMADYPQRRTLPTERALEVI